MRIYVPEAKAFLFVDPHYHELDLIRESRMEEYPCAVDGWEKIDCDSNPNWFHLVFRDTNGIVYYPPNLNAFQPLTPESEASMRAVRFCINENGYLCYHNTTTDEMMGFCMFFNRSNPEDGAMMHSFCGFLANGENTEEDTEEMPCPFPRVELCDSLAHANVN